MTASSTTTNADTTTLTLPSDTEIVITRVFDAPPPLVFAAWTKPEHVRNWWGLRGTHLAVCEIDLRPGGAYRFVERDPDGNDFPFEGEFREIEPPSRLVYTQAYDVEPYAGHPAVMTITFEARAGGKTLMTNTSVYESREFRDGLIESGMEWGMRETLDRLEELLATIA